MTSKELKVIGLCDRYILQLENIDGHFSPILEGILDLQL